MKTKAPPGGWVVSVTTSGLGGLIVVELYDAAIPCVIAALEAVRSIARAGPDAVLEVLEELSRSELVGLEMKPGEARLQ